MAEIPKTRNPNLRRKKEVPAEVETAAEVKETRSRRPAPVFVARGPTPVSEESVPAPVDARAWIGALKGLKSPAGILAAASLVLTALLAHYFFGAGIREGWRAAEIARVESQREGENEIRPETAAELDAALERMQSGDLKGALEQLGKLEMIRPPISSLAYYQALAAVRMGDLDLAARKAEQSIEKRERVSDSLALQAVIETLRVTNATQRPLRDPSIRAEELLREAAAADTANPAPLIGLARLARARGKNEEALQLLRGARNRLHPVENSTTVEVTIELTRLQGLTDDQLPADSLTAEGVVEIFGGAYAAMRRGDHARAAQLLESSRRKLSPEIFRYLLHDPAIRRFSDEPALARYFKGS